MRLPQHVAVAVIVGASGTASQAQTPSPSPTPVVAEYVEVTATRIRERPDEVPVPVEVFTGTELRAKGAVDLPAALSLAAGVDVSAGGDGGPASSVPEMLGLREFDAFLLVVDGVPWGGAFNPALSTLSLEDVERIEVLRGAAPVMYGATSFVGVIQVVRKDPGNVRNVITARGGSYGSFGGAFAARLGELGSWRSALSADGDTQDFRDDRTSFRRGHALWRNTRSWGAGRAWFNLEGTLVDQDPASPHLREGRTLSSRTPLDANYNPSGAFLNDRRGALFTGFDRPFGTKTWQTSASVSKAKSDILRGFLVEASDPAPVRGIREKIDFTDVYVDSHLSWLARDAVKVVGGLDYLHGNADAEGADFDYFAPLDGGTAASAVVPSVLDVKIEDKRDFGGIYSFAEWNASPRLRLEGGLRLNLTHEERGEGEREVAGPKKEEGNNNTKLSGSAGFLFKAWAHGGDHVSVFADYRNTFKPAAIDFGIGETEGEGILKPETAQSFDGGVKARGFDGRLSFEVSAFTMGFKNLVIARTVNGLPSLTNSGSQRFKGVETAAAWRVATGLSLRGTLSFHDSKFRDFVQEFDGVPTQLRGKRLEMSAGRLASAGLLYAPEKGPVGSFQVKYVGDRYLNKRNTALADGFATIAAGIGYRLPRWEVRVDGTNLADRRDPVAESELGDAQYYRLHPRRVMVTVSRSF